MPTSIAHSTQKNHSSLNFQLIDKRLSSSKSKIVSLALEAITFTKSTISTASCSFKKKPIEVIYDKQFEFVAEAFLTHLAESFHTPKTTLECESVAPEAAFSIFNASKSLSLPLEDIQLGTQNAPEEVYRAFLNEGPRIRRNLFLRFSTTRDFQYSPSEVFKLDLFHVSDGNWVHLQDFMECRSIVVTNTTANPDMYSENPAQRFNEFFKVWQGSSCRMESLRVTIYDSRKLNFEEVTMGLNGTNFTRTRGFQSVDIERRDGRKAVIGLTRMFLTMEMRN